MAILAALVAIGSRFATKILTTALGWASTLLFGRVPASRQIVFLGITFGSVIWVVLLVGVLVPDVGTFLLLLVPSQDIVPEEIIRLGMLVAAALLPAVVGILILSLSPDADRGRHALGTVARGYPLTLLLAVLLVFLAVLAVARKVTSLVRGWSDTHVPLVVEPGAYDDVARDIDEAVTAAGLDVTPRPAPAVMSAPAKWLAAVAGRSSSSLVPDRMMQLHGPELDILIYPMDLLISGKARSVMLARAALASRMTTSHAFLTVSAEGQEIEDRIRRLAVSGTGEGGKSGRQYDPAAAAEFGELDTALTTVEIPYGEWEVLYRQRLQVERDLRARSMMAAEAARTIVPPELVRTLRDGVSTIAEVAGDDRTITALDRAAGPAWAVGARIAAAVVAAAARRLRDGSREEPRAEPLAEPLDDISRRNVDPAPRSS
jgi:hypothetical protein